MKGVAGAIQDKLEQLLEEGEPATCERERNAFDQAAYPYEGRIVIYGAGGLGRRTLNGLRTRGVEPLAFADRNAAAGGSVNGLEVLSPEDAIRKFGADAVFVIAVWNPAVPGGVARILSQLVRSGCRRVVPFVWLFWKYPATFLPYYLWDLPSRVYSAIGSVRQACATFEGPRSQAEFVSHLELRLTGNFAGLNGPVADTQYFLHGLFEPAQEEYFVDCGAYDGDTLRDLADWTGGRFQKAVAFEADPANFAALERTVATDHRLRGRVSLHSAAVGSGRSKLRFTASGLASAAISESGDFEVDSVSLDDTILDERPTYIKMDIEGAEIEALRGASSTLRRHRPMLAVCTYHTQDHLWEVPLKLRELAPYARLALRPHCNDGFDLVCYAMPPGRSPGFFAEESAA